MLHFWEDFFFNHARVRDLEVKWIWGYCGLRAYLSQLSAGFYQLETRSSGKMASEKMS
jgi:hypothetical protein